MDPKFQSSFIPKGPVTSSGLANLSNKENKIGIFGFLATLVFILTLVASGVVFGYNLYLTSSIAQMGNDLTTAKASLDPTTINQISRLNSRIVSTQAILGTHIVLSPFFAFLESSTLKSVRWTGFNYGVAKGGLQLIMQGQATGYSALALQADIFNKSKYIKSPLFTDLTLNDKGNVTFAFSAVLNPSIVSYKTFIQNNPPTTTVMPDSTSTAPTINRVSTSTTPSTSSPQSKK